MAAGYGAGDAAALHFAGTELERVVSSRPAARAFYVSADPKRGVRERKLPVRYLGAVAESKALAA
jgi:dipeptidase E